MLSRRGDDHITGIATGKLGLIPRAATLLIGNAIDDDRTTGRWKGVHHGSHNGQVPGPFP